MSDIIVSFYDYSYVKITTSKAILMELRDNFSFFVDGYKFSPKFLYGSWDGKIALLDKEGMLPLGLLPTLVKYASKNNISIYIDDNLNIKENIDKDLFIDWINSSKYYSGSVEIFPYLYQIEAVYNALVNKRHILNLPTSAGKSLIQALLTKYMIEHTDKSVLILVPTVGLVDQMKSDFIDYKIFNADDIAEVRSGSKQGNQRIVVSTWQSAIKKPAKWFDKFGMLLCDEMHLSTGKSITSIINKLSNCEYKIGLSGSLRDGKANLMQYVGLFGGIFNPVSTKDLMNSGQISKLQINAIVLKYPEKVSVAMKNQDYQSEIKFITGLKQRIEWVSSLAYKLSSKNENVFVMFKHIEHGKKIYEEIKNKDHSKVFYVSGEISAEQRSIIKNTAENESGVIIIASYGVFSTGISVKNLHHVIFAHPIKSKTTVLQTIGRVLRKHKSKDIAKLWDIIDDMSIKVNGVTKNSNYALKHAVERINRYKLEKFDYVIKNVKFLE